MKDTKRKGTQPMPAVVRKLGPGVSVLAICQPAPAAIVAATMLAEAKDPATPRHLILMGGPIDTLKGPTEVTRLAKQHGLATFEAAREALARFGREALRHYIISHTESVSDLLEVALLLKETGLLRGTLDGYATSDLIVVPRNVPHRLINDSDAPVRTYIVFSSPDRRFEPTGRS